MWKLTLRLLAGASIVLFANIGPASAQQASERDAILALIEKLGGKATQDERRPERPIVAVDI